MHITVIQSTMSVSGSILVPFVVVIQAMSHTVPKAHPQLLLPVRDYTTSTSPAPIALLVLIVSPTVCISQLSKVMPRLLLAVPHLQTHCTSVIAVHSLCSNTRYLCSNMPLSLHRGSAPQYYYSTPGIPNNTLIAAPGQRTG